MKTSEIFTLIELLVVIVIIAVLAAFLLPALNRARLSAASSNCMSNNKQIALYMQQYAADFSAYYPLAGVAPRWEEVDEFGSPGWTNSLRIAYGAEKNIFHCSRDIEREFSYSLNCREPYLRFSGFASWRQMVLDRSKVGASRLILVEETGLDNDTFLKDDSDHDNYTQDCEPKDFDRHGGVIVLFTDGHAEKLLAYDFAEITYFTGVMKNWSDVTSITW